MVKADEYIHPRDIKPDSIEHIVCDRMATLKNVPMDKDSMEIMVGFMLDPESKEKAAEIIKDVMPALAIEARMKAQFGRVMDPRVAIMIAVVAETVGAAILYMYYCEYICKKKGIQGDMTWDHLISFFPMGFFAKEDIDDVWDEQKVDNRRENFPVNEITGGSDNLVDYGYAAQSIA